MVFQKGHIGYWTGKKRDKKTIEKRKRTMLLKYGKLLGRKKTTMSKECLICNKIFSGPRWYIRNMKYCSNKCRFNYSKHNKHGISFSISH